MTKYCVAAHVKPEACADCVKPKGVVCCLDYVPSKSKKTIGEGVILDGV